jgi:hypothetical protein
LGHDGVLSDSCEFCPCQISRRMLSPLRLEILERNLTFIGAEDTEVQLAQAFPGALLERKECFHQCMIVLLDEFGTPVPFPNVSWH